MFRSGQTPEETIALLHEELESERIAREHAEQQAELGLNLLYRRQAELGLMAGVARAANEAAALDVALAAALRAMCEFGEWEIGHALVRTDAAAPLVSARAWHVADPVRFNDFVAESERTSFARGAELPGEVLARARPCGRAWPQPQDQSARALVARASGLVAGYAFPVSAGGLGDAVVELYSVRAHGAAEPFFELVPQIAAQLGRMLERHWAGERLQRSQAELEAKVRERTETLATTVVELNKQMTELRRTQQALMLHDRAVSAAANGIALVNATDAAHPILYCNPAFERLTGYTSREIIGRSYRMLLPAATTPEEERAAETFRKFALAGKRAQVVIKTPRQDGSWFWNQLTVSPVRDAFGMLTHFVGIIEDIGERMQAEDVLRRAKETAEAANAELSRAARLKDEFLAAMSHELRTPLNAILGLSQAMQENVYGDVTAPQQEAMRTIHESGHHLLSLINDILDLSKVESGKLALALDEVDGIAVAQASLRFIREEVQKKRLVVTAELPADLPIFVADARRLKQMLVNLLSNAVKFTREGGRLGLEIRADTERQLVHFAVWDTGIGIAPADQARLFQTFVQIDSKLSRSYGGTGLGLALVRGMAQLHGGQVSVESELGQGSRFTITLPLRTLDAPTPAAPPPAPTATVTTAPFGREVRVVSRRGGNVLLAEDNELNRKTFTEYLTACGYSVSLAADGAEAVNLVEQTRPDLVLMDVQMPKMDGLEATRRIRGNPALAQTPIIALTALAMVGDDVRCLQAGVDKYLSKPVNLRELNTAIQDLLTRRRVNPVQN